LHKVGDHWTPYQPPTEFPPDAQVYIIVPGDTLWALAKQNLGNPYLWPQLWEANTYIRDAHWIYPGDPLVMGVKAVEVAPPPPAGGDEGAAAGGTGAGETPAGTGEGQEPGQGAGTEAAGKLVSIGSEDDIYCFAYLRTDGSKQAIMVASAEQIEFQAQFVTGDIVFLSGGESEGVKPGDEFLLTLPVRALRHPRTEAKLGTVVRHLGHARVICVQEHTATAEILSSCDGVPIGAWAEPFQAIPIPMVYLTPPATRCDPTSGKAQGTITYAKDDAVTFGRDHMVLIDLGEADETTAGTVLTVFRNNPVPGAPRILLGEAAVLVASDHWATAKIIESAKPMQVGDRVEAK